MELKPCPFCGCIPRTFDCDFELIHTKDCYLYQPNSTDWIVSDRKARAWNQRCLYQIVEDWGEE